MKGLKRRLVDQYGFNIKDWDVIKYKKNSSLVAKITTEKGKKFALKSLFIPPKRQQFIVSSEQLLSQKGVALARPVATLTGDLYIVHKQVPYVLYEWIKGEGGQLRHRGDLKSIVKVIARFHLASRDLNYPSDMKIYTHPHWKKEYKTRIKSINRWYNTHKKSKNQKKAVICSSIPFFLKAAKKALSELKKSRYQEYIEGGSAQSLVHGDMHHKNLINQGKSKVLIDFEDVRYDLPSKDLLRIFSMYTKSHPFTALTFRSMMRAYERNCPLPAHVKQLVYIDFLFPHIFERMLRKNKYKGMSINQIKHRVKQERKKADYAYHRYFRTHSNNGEET